MTDQYPPLRPQAPIRRQQTGVPWPMMAAIGLLLIVALALIVLLLTRNDDQTASGSGSPTPSGTASESASASASGSPEASPSASASAASAAPSASAAPLALDTIVGTTVDRLSVRSGPGIGEEKLGTLENGAQSFLANGPVDADGFRWYYVATLGLPPNTGCAGEFETDPYNCPAWYGWVASASESGEPWLQPVDPECPTEPYTTESLIGAGKTNLQRLACLGSEPVTFRAWWPELPEDGGLGGACAPAEEPSGWLLCQNINYDTLTISEEQGFGGIGARISIDPASGLAMPERGTWVEVRVHLDDPAAQGCDEAAAAHDSESDPEQVIVLCRGEMVLEAVTVVDGP